MSATHFLTLERATRAQIEVKRSRFLCDVVPVHGDVPTSAEDGPTGTSEGISVAEAQARAVVESARKEHWDARHHCSAFVLGPQGQVRRSSDDGEPSGTAGAPMLDALVGAGVTDVVAVVTRWFGGTLLGAGGLVRAYGDAVRAALDDAVIVSYERRALVDATVDVTQAGRVENALRGADVGIEGVDYATAAAAGRVVLRLAVSPSDVEGSETERLGALVAELTGAPAELTARGETWARRAT